MTGLGEVGLFLLAILANMDYVSTLPNPIEDMTMKTRSSVEVQNRFGSIANIVKSGEPVAVTQYGTPTMMILPYSLATEVLRDYNARKLVQFMDVMPSRVYGILCKRGCDQSLGILPSN